MKQTLFSTVAFSFVFAATVNALPPPFSTIESRI